MPLQSLDGTNATQFSKQSIVLDTTAANPAYFSCVTKAAKHNASPNLVDTATLCNPGGQRPGVTTHTLDLTVYLSQGTNGSLNWLIANRNRLVNFAILTDGSLPPGPGNIEITGRVYVPDVSWLNGETIGEATAVDISFPLYGQPAANTTVTPVYSGHLSPV